MWHYFLKFSTLMSVFLAVIVFSAVICIPVRHRDIQNKNSFKAALYRLLRGNAPIFLHYKNKFPSKRATTGQTVFHRGYSNGVFSRPTYKEYKTLDNYCFFISKLRKTCSSKHKLFVFVLCYKKVVCKIIVAWIGISLRHKTLEALSKIFISLNAGSHF